MPIKKIKMLGFTVGSEVVGIPLDLQGRLTLKDIVDTVHAIPAIDVSLTKLEARHSVKTDYMPPQDSGTVEITYDQVPNVTEDHLGQMILFGSANPKVGLIMSVGEYFFNVRLIPNS